MARHLDLGEADPYRVLGVARNAPLDEVRRHYRRLVASNHPDRLIARGLPEEFIAIATSRLAAINAAYELIERGPQGGMTGFAPDHPGAEVRVSPNFGMRREAVRPELIVLHYTGMETGEAAEAWLCDPISEVSSHYLVHEDGRITQMVREADRAWHAGRSSWRGERDVNSLSIGIEVVNPGHAFGYRDFTRAQVATVIALCRGIAERHGVRPEGVLAHSDVAPGRKVDPGERFPWSELAAAGVGHFVPPAPPQDGAFLAEGDRGEAVESLQSMLAVYGYGVEINGNFDRQTTQVVEAFQRHFRQSSVDGIADGSTVLTLRNLLESLPESLV